MAEEYRVSVQTKADFSAALKALMKTKPLTAVTVSELCRLCGVNRKTFYYHFSDVHELLKWTLEHEAFSAAGSYDLKEDPRAFFCFVLDYLEQNSCMIRCAYESIGQEGLKRLLCLDMRDAVRRLLPPPEEYRAQPGYAEFLLEFFTAGTAGLLLDWTLDRGLTREQAMEYFLTLTCHMQDAFRAAGG